MKKFFILLKSGKTIEAIAHNLNEAMSKLRIHSADVKSYRSVG